jgi:peroxiredoxin
VLRDLGAAGTLFEYPAAGVGGMLVPPATTDPDAAPATDPATDAAATVAAIYLYESFSGTTADGLETDSPLSEWTAALGDGVPDPFLPAVHIPTEGLVLGLDGDTVSAITLGAGACAPGPRPDTVSCPPSPPFGCALGDVMEDITFSDAGGSTLSLHGLCGSAMTLLYHYYGWCATCGTFASGLADLMADYGPKGLGLVFVVAEDPLSRAATPDYCQQVKEQYGLPGFVACDPDHLLEACGANGLLVLLDSSLNVVFKQEGPSVEAVRKALDKGLE